MLDKSKKIRHPHQILDPDFVDWVIRKELFLILEDPGVPDDVERAATILYNWFSNPSNQLPEPTDDWRSLAQ